MADGKNQARSLRVLEIMNDFRTLQLHINQLITQPSAQPPDRQSAALPGYALMRQCSAQAQTILSQQYSPGSVGVTPGQIADTEVQKALLQRVILDASTRRFRAHKIYLQTACGARWIQSRNQTLNGQPASSRNAAALQAVDQRLRQELAAITDQHVSTSLRTADTRHRYWMDEDPSLERILEWARRNNI